ncbi:hypothetical protein M0804_013975 [Polistes exclamans]|nr:hypothetical protein M0804_013975 [Polistes exclamans]
MNYILKKIEGTLSFTASFRRVYVDGIVTAVLDSFLVLKILNSVNKKIQFTIEIENNGALPFLDTKIIRNEDGSILTICIIKGLLFRALTLGYKQFHIEIRNRIESLLKNSKCPTSLIHMVFTKFKLDKDCLKDPHNQQNKKFVRFRFIKPLSNKIVELRLQNTL